MGKKAQEIESTVRGNMESALAETECLRDEMQEWHDNLPESLQNGDKGVAVEEAVSALETIMGYIEEGICYLDSAEGSFDNIEGEWESLATNPPSDLEVRCDQDTRARLTRGARLENVANMAQSAAGILTLWCDAMEDAAKAAATAREAAHTDAETDPNDGWEWVEVMISEARMAVDSLESVDALDVTFPRAFGA